MVSPSAASPPSSAAPRTSPPPSAATVPPHSHAPAVVPGVQPAGLFVFLGAALVVASFAIQLPDAMEDMGGKDQASYLLFTFGGWIVGLGLVGAGAFARGPWGVRAAYVIAGAFLLPRGSNFASLFFNMFGGFGAF